MEKLTVNSLVPTARLVNKNKSGAAMGFVLVFITLFVLLGTSMMMMAQANMRQVASVVAMDRNTLAAEAMAHRAAQHFINDLYNPIAVAGPWAQDLRWNIQDILRRISEGDDDTQFLDEDLIPFFTVGALSTEEALERRAGVLAYFDTVSASAAFPSLPILIPCENGCNHQPDSSPCSCRYDDGCGCSLPGFFRAFVNNGHSTPVNPWVEPMGDGTYTRLTDVYMSIGNNNVWPVASRDGVPEHFASPINIYFVATSAGSEVTATVTFGLRCNSCNQLFTGSCCADADLDNTTAPHGGNLDHPTPFISSVRETTGRRR